MAMADDLRLSFIFIPDGEVIPANAFGGSAIRLRATNHPTGIAGKSGQAPALDTFTFNTVMQVDAFCREHIAWINRADHDVSVKVFQPPDDGGAPPGLMTAGRRRD